uniref:Diacylglycerol kinase n=1 Tax=Timema genevievae TaxID=629358 RepID=A0A7R9PMB4_TIMGE|nr:unnamed protein product [Timema genevievae]
MFCCRAPSCPGVKCRATNSYATCCTRLHEQLCSHGAAVIFDEIDLTDLSFAECSIKNVNHSFQVITPFRRLVLCAESRREMEEWISALKAASTRDYYEAGEHQDFLSGHHHWYATSHARPTYCNVCREALSGVTSHGLSCEVCKCKVHKRCAVKAISNCKWTTLSSVGKDIIEDEHGNITMPHQWMEGNLPVSAKCVVCDKTCGSVLRLQDWRCLWCRATVHTACSDEAWEAVRPQGCSPLLVFVNSKSGDNQGVKFLRRFKQLLNPAQVFDLISTGPGLGLRLFRHFDPFRILVCSGDGSVGWVLSEIDRLNMHKQCQLGVLPLGTGNDLARVLGWGSSCDDDTHLPQLLDKYETASTKMLDRWSIMTFERSITMTRKLSHPDPAFSMAAYEDSVVSHLTTILQSDQHSVVIASAKVLCETVKDFTMRAAAVSLGQGDQQFSDKCQVLKEKLDLLLSTLHNEESLSSQQAEQPLPEGEEKSSLDMPEKHLDSSESVLYRKEALMSRANSLKKAIRQLVQHTEQAVDEQNKTTPSFLVTPPPPSDIPPSTSPNKLQRPALLPFHLSLICGETRPVMTTSPCLLHLSLLTPDAAWCPQSVVGTLLAQLSLGATRPVSKGDPLLQRTHQGGASPSSTWHWIPITLTKEEKDLGNMMTATSQHEFVRRVSQQESTSESIELHRNFTESVLSQVDGWEGTESRGPITSALSSPQDNDTTRVDVESLLSTEDDDGALWRRFSDANTLLLPQGDSLDASNGSRRASTVLEDIEKDIGHIDSPETTEMEDLKDHTSECSEVSKHEEDDEPTCELHEQSLQTELVAAGFDMCRPIIVQSSPEEEVLKVHETDKEDSDQMVKVRGASLAHFSEGNDIARKSFYKHIKPSKTAADKSLKLATVGALTEQEDGEYLDVVQIQIKGSSGNLNSEASTQRPSLSPSESRDNEELLRFHIQGLLVNSKSEEAFPPVISVVVNPPSPVMSDEGAEEDCVKLRRHSDDAVKLSVGLDSSPAATRRISSGSLLKMPELAGRERSRSVDKECYDTSPAAGGKRLPIINPLVRLPMWPNVSTGAGLISKVLLANADALCAAVSPLMDPDETLMEGYFERSVMNNYFGIGIDAKISLDFHQKREEHPEKCRSRAKNYMWYGVLGSKECFQKTFKNLEQRVQLECDGQRIPLPSLQGIVILNIPSFMGGTNFWGGTKEDDCFLAPSFDDRILEVVAVFGSVQMAASRLINLQHHRIAQCQTVQITILGDEGVPVQVDGEAWVQPSGVIRIIHKNRMQMLCRNRALETSLRQWEEKQKHQQQSLGHSQSSQSQSSQDRVSRRLSTFSEEENQVLLIFIECITTLVNLLSSSSSSSDVSASAGRLAHLFPFLLISSNFSLSHASPVYFFSFPVLLCLVHPSLPWFSNRYVKLLIISHPSIEPELYELAAQISAHLEKLHPGGKIVDGLAKALVVLSSTAEDGEIEPELRTQVTELVSSSRQLYDETCHLLREKAHQLRLREDLEGKLSAALGNMEMELRICVTYDSAGLVHFQQPENQGDRKGRGRGLSWLKFRRGGGGSRTTRDVATWGTEEVATWLEALQLAEYAESFMQHDIRGRELLALCRRDLKELGVTKVGHVKRILQAVRDLSM